MEIRNLTCIGCPLGCQIQVTLENGEVSKVTGNTCKRGDIYARKEVTSPTRILTSSVAVAGGNLPMVSVKTAQDIPKEKIDQVMEAVKKIRVQAPVTIGQVLLENVAETGVEIVATKNISQKK